MNGQTSNLNLNHTDMSEAKIYFNLLAVKLIDDCRYEDLEQTNKTASQSRGFHSWTSTSDNRYRQSIAEVIKVKLIDTNMESPTEPLDGNASKEAEVEIPLQDGNSDEDPNAIPTVEPTDDPLGKLEEVPKDTEEAKESPTADPEESVEKTTEDLPKPAEDDANGKGIDASADNDEAKETSAETPIPGPSKRPTRKMRTMHELSFGYNSDTEDDTYPAHYMRKELFPSYADDPIGLDKLLYPKKYRKPLVEAKKKLTTLEEKYTEMNKLYSTLDIPKKPKTDAKSMKKVGKIVVGKENKKDEGDEKKKDEGDEKKKKEVGE